MPSVIPQVTENASMKIDLDSEEIAWIVKALEHYHAYLWSQQRDDSRYLQLAERLRPQYGVSGSKHSTAPGIGRSSEGTPISS
jgi:hypothetical protein